MRLYQIRPSKDLDPRDSTTYVEQAASLISHCLRAATDTSLYGVWREGEIGMQDIPSSSTHGNNRVVEFTAPDQVTEIVRKCLSDTPPFHMWIRSRTTCRSAFPIHDSVAYLCLGTTDPPPVSASPLIEVVECSELLTNTDYLDGDIDWDS